MEEEKKIKAENEYNYVHNKYSVITNNTGQHNF